MAENASRVDTPTGQSEGLGIVPGGHFDRLLNGDASDRVMMTLSRPAAVFLAACVEHMNQRKLLPADNAQALETSAWLEEIGAAAVRAAPAGELAELVDAYARLDARCVSAQQECEQVASERDQLALALGHIESVAGRFMQRGHAGFEYEGISEELAHTLQELSLVHRTARDALSAGPSQQRNNEDRPVSQSGADGTVDHRAASSTSSHDGSEDTE